MRHAQHLPALEEPPEHRRVPSPRVRLMESARQHGARQSFPLSLPGDKISSPLQDQRQPRQIAREASPSLGHRYLPAASRPTASLPMIPPALGHRLLCLRGGSLPLPLRRPGSFLRRRPPTRHGRSSRNPGSHQSTRRAPKAQTIHRIPTRTEHHRRFPWHPDRISPRSRPPSRVYILPAPRPPSRTQSV